MQWPKEKGHKY